MQPLKFSNGCQTTVLIKAKRLTNHRKIMKFAPKLTDFTLTMFLKRLRTVNVPKYGPKE